MRRAAVGASSLPPPAKESALRLGIRVFQPEKPELPAEVDRVVVAAYGLYIPQRLLDRSLWLNVHPSLLPRWRGAAPVERAILAGDDETGVTIHRTVAELDAGPIAAREAFAVGELDAGEVFARSGEIAARLLGGVLESRYSSRRTSTAPRTPRRSRPAIASSTSAIPTTPGGGCARSRRTSAPGRRCTAAA